MSQQDSGPALSGWAVGGITFAVVMMIMIGVFQVIAGLVAIFNDDFYVVTQNYTFDLDARRGAGSTCCSGSCSCSRATACTRARRGRQRSRS